MKELLENKWIKAAVISGALILIINAAILILRISGQLVDSISMVLTPFLFALIVAYIFRPMAEVLERIKVVKPWASAAIVLVCVLLVFGLGGIYFIIAITKEVASIGDRMPDWIEKAQPYKQWLTDNLLPQWDKYQPVIIEKLNEIGPHVLDTAKNWVGRVISSFIGSVGTIFGLVMVPILVFYFLRDYNMIGENLPYLIPTRFRNEVKTVWGKLDEVLRNFFRGQLTVSAILAALSIIGFLIVGVPLAIPLGILVGFSNLVPYMMVVTGLIPMILSLIEFGDWQHPVGVLVVIIISQALEGTVITPKIIGDSTGLHPLVVILAVLFFGTLLGFLGIMLAVPLMAIVVVVGKHLIDKYDVLRTKEKSKLSI
jgi:predicted PurR-regulated permease PerM